MKRTVFSLFVATSAIIFISASVSTANAQRVKESRGRFLTRSQVKSVINRVETQVDYFVKNFDRSLDRSYLDGSGREDRLNARAKDLERATDELRSEFDRNDAWIENKDEVRRCLNIATDIDRSLKANRFGARTEANWARVRRELNSLADVYDLPFVSANVYK